MRVNPPARELGSVNAIVAGRARRYEVKNFRGPLSLKSVLSGSAVWETSSGRFEVLPGSVLVLNDGETRVRQPGTGRDVTEAMDGFADRFLAGLGSVEGFLLKRLSPTCGSTDRRRRASSSRATVRQTEAQPTGRPISGGLELCGPGSRRRPAEG